MPDLPCALESHFLTLFNEKYTDGSGEVSCRQIHKRDPRQVIWVKEYRQRNVKQHCDSAV